MNPISDRALLQSINVVHGNSTAGDINLFAIMKNEMYYLRAFLDHYRSLGVEKFFIIDDGSTDGSFEFLISQPDCAVLRSDFSYGQQIRMRGRLQFWKARESRAGIEFKRIVPAAFSAGHWCIYADADEFLLLPSEFSSLPQYIKVLEQRRLRLVLSSMVDFYPATFKDLSLSKESPKSFWDLVGQAPYFDATPMLEFGVDGIAYVANLSVNDRLVQKYGVRHGTENEEPQNEAVSSVRKKVGRGARKVSLFKPGNGLYLKGSHHATIEPPSGILNCIAHFKYTPDVFRRVSLARESRAWANGSKKYDILAALLEAMETGDDTFLTRDSVRFESVTQLEACKNIIFPSQ